MQTAVVEEAKLTANPEEAVALKLGAAVPRVWVAIDWKVMVCVVGGGTATGPVPDVPHNALDAALPSAAVSNAVAT